MSIFKERYDLFKKYLQKKYRSLYLFPSMHWKEGLPFGRYVPKRSDGPIHILLQPGAEEDLTTILSSYRSRVSRLESH